MNDLIFFIFSSFWIWIGFVILIGIPLNFIYQVINRLLRHRSIMKHGYPEGTDADGEYPKKTEIS